jgi:dephospho-CoA kinase
MILGLTGGLGCGKSTAARLFAQRGFRRLDSDALVRDHIYAQPEVVAALRDRLGPEAVLVDGTVNRTHVANIVFNDDTALKWLEDLAHPRLFAHWRDLWRSEPEVSWVVEVPLLFEKQLENWFDFIACVTCAPNQQLTRLEQRGLNRALAVQRISKQLPLARKIELSDFVLLNDGSAEFLQKQVDLLVDSLPPARG